MAGELEALNFAMAGAREGFGPFLGVYLQSRGFDPALTGVAMSLAGTAGVLATTPLGMAIDRFAAKRLAVGVAVASIAAGAGLIVASDRLSAIAAGQIAIGIADTSLAPLVAALTLGIVGQARYGGQVARNEIFNHGGNAANAALAAGLGYAFGLGWVALAIAVMAAATVLVVRRIDPIRIDFAAARGGEPGSRPAWRTLAANRPLLVIGLAAFTFETASGALLPFVAQALVRAGRNPALVTGGMTIAVQLTMVGAAAAVPKLARRFGHAGVLSAALALVVVRAGIAAASATLPAIAGIALLEGVSTGFAGVAIPALVAEVMAGSGHATAGLGGAMTAFGAGAALSPLLAGVIATAAGFPAAFLALGGVAALGLAAWIVGWSFATRAEAGTVPDGQPGGAP